MEFADEGRVTEVISKLEKMIILVARAQRHHLSRYTP
jgi:hypothetical protein